MVFDDSFDEDVLFEMIDEESNVDKNRSHREES
jgi:hypothetical protein